MFDSARCPWCREHLDADDRERGFCSHCGRELLDENGRELRALDLRYEEVEEELRRRLKLLLLRGTPLAVLLGFLVPLTHVAALMLIPAMALAHLALIRLYIQGVGRAYYGFGRNLGTRWMTRLVFLWIGGPCYGMAVIPVFGGLAAGACFAGLSRLAVWYEQRNLFRERQRLPAAGWEKLLLVLLGTLTLVVVLLVLLFSLLLGFSLQALLSWLQK